MKKIFLFAVFFFLSSISFASASTDGWCYNFKKDLKFGDRGEDVEAIKVALTKEGFYKEGWVSDSFDVYIAAALMGFQDKYRSDILTPAGLTDPTGMASKNTRKKLNTLFVCSQPSLVAKDVKTVSDVAFSKTERDSVVKNALEYIKKYLATGMDVAVNKVEDFIRPFYRFEVKTSGGVVPTYVSTDGKLMVFQETDITKTPTVPEVAPVVEIKKTDKPQVELFVMSHCPYGTQIEKGIIPVVEALGDKIDFQLKFCDYAMHNEKELKEELNQYCIQKEQKDKLLTYLKCFLKDENSSSSCVTVARIDNDKLQACVSSTDKEFKVLENFKNNVGFNGQFPGFDIFKNDNAKYSIQGSPALVINGVQSQSGRDSNSLLTTICSGFNSVPDVCKNLISADVPAPGFGEGSVPAGTAGGCGQ